MTVCTVVDSHREMRSRSSWSERYKLVSARAIVGSIGILPFDFPLLITKLHSDILDTHSLPF